MPHLVWSSQIEVPTASATKGDPSQGLGPAGNAVPSLAVLFRPNARLRHESSVLSLRYRFPASSPSRARTAAVIGGLAASLHRSRLDDGQQCRFVRQDIHPPSILHPLSMPVFHHISSHHPSSSPLDRLGRPPCVKPTKWRLSRLAPSRVLSG